MLDDLCVLFRFHQFFVIILLDEEVRVLDHSNSCRVVEDFKLSIFSQNPK